MTASLFDRYHALLKTGAIGGDPAQARAAEALHRRPRALTTYHASGRSVLERLVRAKDRAPPKGIYLHGEVGRGKSMLMDLFFESVMLKHKRRVHFNAFMVETHQRLHEW